MPTSHHLRDNKLLLAQERMAKSTEAEEKISFFFVLLVEKRRKKMIFPLLVCIMCSGWMTGWCGLSSITHCCIILSFLHDNEEILLKTISNWMDGSLLYIHTHRGKDCWVRLWRMSDLLMMLLLMYILSLYLTHFTPKKIVYLFEAILLVLISATYENFEWVALVLHTAYAWTLKKGVIMYRKVRKSHYGMRTSSCFSHFCV